MLRAFNSSATGMAAQQVVLDNTANNLANLNTTGFKRSTVEFQDLLYSTLRQPGATSTQGQQVPTGIQLGNGVRKVLHWTDRHGTVAVPFRPARVCGLDIDPFFNANTPQELDQLRAMLAKTAKIKR